MARMKDLLVKKQSFDLYSDHTIFRSIYIATFRHNLNFIDELTYFVGLTFDNTFKVISNIFSWSFTSHKNGLVIDIKVNMSIIKLRIIID